MPRPSWLPLLLAVCSACGDEFDVRYHGRVRIAEGDFRVLTTLSEGDQEFALVVDRESDGSPLVLLPFDGSPGCAAPEPAAAFFAVQTRSGPRIAVYGSSERPRHLQFIDERCNPHLDPQPDSIRVEFETEFFLVETASGSLHYYDPWDDEQMVISDRLDARGSLVDTTGGLEFVPDATWLLEDGELLLRSFDGTVLERAGNQVEEVAVANNRQEMIFSDAEGLFRLRRDGSAPEPLAEPGCQLRYDRIILPGGPSYLATMFSPCEERSLVTVDPVDDAVTRIATGVVSHFRYQRIAADNEIELWTFYVTQAPDAPADERHYFVVAPDGETTSELDVPLGRQSLIHMVHPEPRWLFTTDEDEPRLGTWSADTGFETIVERAHAVVASPLGLLVLHHVDPERGGTLDRFDLDGERETVARHVPEDGLIGLQLTPPPAALSSALQAIVAVDSVLHDYDGEVGTLSLLLPPPVEMVTLARDVPLSATNVYLTSMRGPELTQPLETAQILAYLENFDAERGAGRLSALLPTGKVLTIDEGVGSHTGITDPNRSGLLYAIRHGPRRGLWFARQ